MAKTMCVSPLESRARRRRSRQQLQATPLPALLMQQPLLLYVTPQKTNPSKHQWTQGLWCQSTTTSHFVVTDHGYGSVIHTAGTAGISSLYCR